MATRNNRGMHSGQNRRPSSRRKADWSSSVIGSHATGSRRPQPQRRSAARPASRPHINAPSGKRTGEVRQLRFPAESAGGRAGRRGGGQTRTESFMRHRDYMSRATLVIGIVIVVVIALSLGTCAYRNSLTSSMALNDDSVSSTLVSAKADQPTYTLFAGISNGEEGEYASYLALLRVDAQNNTLSLLNIPSNITASYSNSDAKGNMLRDAPHIKDEGELVRQVSSLVGQGVNHYVRITDEDFASLVDSLGGLNVDVKQYVDDPTVGTSVLDPGQQTLNGKQALVYVSAKNYNEGYGQRADVQNQVFSAFVDALEAKGGLDFAMSADDVAGKIKTDMSYDEIGKIASLFPNATFYSSTVPGSQSTSGNKASWSVSTSAFATISDQFKNGQNMDASVDTSGVDKSAVSVIVLNGAGADGYSAQAAQVLTNAGYTIKDTGNAESFVYDETLVIYRSDEDKLAAEAIVKDLGAGRAVSAGVYYNLSTNIQVVVGKDWTSHV